MIRPYIEAHWVAAAMFMGVALLLLVPLGIPADDDAIRLIYLAAPIYMLHQVEEHLGDRFRRYVNGIVFDNREALTSGDVLLINLPGVWGVNLAALYAAHFFGAGWGLSAIYLILVNGLTHLGMAAHLRRTNPGLGSALLVFIPFGLFAIFQIPATALQHGIALALALGIHAAIAVHAVRRAHAARAARAAIGVALKA